MCRNIKTLFNFDPPATTDEVQASALQFVRKLSGMNKPAKANEEAFHLAVERVSAAAAGNAKFVDNERTAEGSRDRSRTCETAKCRAVWQSMI